MLVNILWMVAHMTLRRKLGSSINKHKQKAGQTLRTCACKVTAQTGWSWLS